MIRRLLSELNSLIIIPKAGIQSHHYWKFPDPSSPLSRITPLESDKLHPTWYTNDILTKSIAQDFAKFDTVVYKPTEQNEAVRPAEVHIVYDTLQYSRKRLWFLGYMIRGLSVEEALKQLGFRSEKGARILEDAIQEGIRRAVDEELVEFSSNLWVENISVVRGSSQPRIRKGVRRNFSHKNYHFTDLMVRLQEGQPPFYYHPSNALVGRFNRQSEHGYVLMKNHLNELRQRRILKAL